MKEKSLLRNIDPCFLLCSFGLILRNNSLSNIVFEQKCLIKDVKSFIKTSLIVETSKKKYAANYTLQLRNDLLTIKNETLLCNTSN